ncbi:MAG: head GIN domain-containing protein [Dysgonomonas sp.]
MKVLFKTAISCILISLVYSCSINQTPGNKIITNNEIQISDYSTLSIAGSGNLIYEQRTDTAAYLRIEIDENLFPLLDIKSNNNSLSIEPKSEYNIAPTKFNIYTNSSTLAVLKVAGANEILLKGKLNTESLSIALAGSSHLKIDSIACKTLNMNIAGSGEVDLAGTATEAKYKGAGSSKIRAYNLLSDSVTCKIAGSGKMQIYAEKWLNIDIAGSGDITYRGNAEVTQSIAGSGKITKIAD